MFVRRFGLLIYGEARGRLRWRNGRASRTGHAGNARRASRRACVCVARRADYTDEQSYDGGGGCTDTFLAAGACANDTRNFMAARSPVGVCVWLLFFLSVRLRGDQTGRRAER